MAHLIPAILEPNLQSVVDKLTWLKAWPRFWRAQIDVMDGTFTPGKSFNEPRDLPVIGVDCEVHLMVMHPELVLRGWVKHPDVKRVIIHAESTGHLPSLITQIHLAGKEVSLACNPETPSRIFDDYLDLIDGILLLAVEPGRQGQSMNTDVLEKAKELRQRAPHLPLCIDGGVNPETLGRVLALGIQDIVVGSAIWDAPAPEEVLTALADQISTATRA